MLIFIDETFRERSTAQGVAEFGALCGIAIPISNYTKFSNAVYKAKLEIMGKEYADNSEMKGKKLISTHVLRQATQCLEPSRNLL